MQTGLKHSGCKETTLLDQAILLPRGLGDCEPLRQNAESEDEEQGHKVFGCACGRKSWEKYLGFGTPEEGHVGEVADFLRVQIRDYARRRRPCHCHTDDEMKIYKDKQEREEEDVFDGVGCLGF